MRDPKAGHIAGQFAPTSRGEYQPPWPKSGIFKRQRLTGEQVAVADATFSDLRKGRGNDMTA